MMARARFKDEAFAPYDGLSRKTCLSEWQLSKQGACLGRGMRGAAELCASGYGSRKTYAGSRRAAFSVPSGPSGLRDAGVLAGSLIQSLLVGVSWAQKGRDVGGRAPPGADRVPGSMLRSGAGDSWRAIAA